MRVDETTDDVEKQLITQLKVQKIVLQIDESILRLNQIFNAQHGALVGHAEEVSV